jgi:transposase
VHNWLVFLRRIGRKDSAGNQLHWALCESYRTERGPRQRVVAYLGDVSEGLRQGAVDAASGLPRQGDLFSQTSPEYVEVDLKRVRVERSRSFGGAWLALQMISELKLDSFLEKSLPVGNEDVAWSLMSQILAVHRLLDPSSELSIAEGGYEKTALSDLLGVPNLSVNDDRLYRALDRLLPLKAQLEEHLKDRLGKLFGLDYELLLYDLTSTYFEGACNGNKQAQRGYSRDSRPDCKQVTIALVVSRDGFPLGYEVFAGNTADVSTVEDIVEMIEARYGKADRIWAMDRGMASSENFEFLKQEGRRYILGTPKSQLKSYEKELMDSGWEVVREGIEVKKCASPDGAETFILCRSADRKLKDKAIHDKFIRKIEAGLEKIAAGCAKAKHKPGVIERRVGRLLGQNTRAEKLFSVQVRTAANGSAEISWKKREDVRDWSELSEGCYMLRTNVNDWSGQDLWKAYIQLSQAESAFRICKNDLRLRPIWHQKEERVKAHILVCFLAYVLFKTLDMKCRNAGLGDSARKILDEFAAIQMVDVVMPTKAGPVIRKRCVSVPEPHLNILLYKLGMTLPTSVDLRKV